MNRPDISRLLSQVCRHRPASAGLEQVRERLESLRGWQSRRLAATYADFAADTRHRAAVDFFLNDLYGRREVNRRDHDLERALPLLQRMLPSSALNALGLALELEGLSLVLDAAMAEQLPTGAPVDETSYAAAYRQVGREPDRVHQIELAVRAGRTLDALVKKRSIGIALRMTHGPAHMAGFGALQDFLENGFFSFVRMKGATRFLAAIEERETRIMKALLAGEERPFDN